MIEALINPSMTGELTFDKPILLVVMVIKCLHFLLELKSSSYPYHDVTISITLQYPRYTLSSRLPSEDIKSGLASFMYGLMSTYWDSLCNTYIVYIHRETRIFHDNVNTNCINSFITG